MIDQHCLKYQLVLNPSFSPDSPLRLLASLHRRPSCELGNLTVLIPPALPHLAGQSAVGGSTPKREDVL